ncbi:hypothetical protein GCM10027256_01530 [Novispirillum itersonii subsp. nipponicum]
MFPSPQQEQNKNNIGVSLIFAVSVSPLSAQGAAHSPMEDIMSIGRFVTEFLALLSLLVMIYMWGVLGYALHA